LDINLIAYQVSVWVLPALLAITLHEAAHGYAAERFGDDTARRLGRVSLNPLRHIDPFGTILLPGFLLLAGAPFLLGYAKPVPVDFWRLRHPRRDMVYVAAAGPAMNLALAMAGALLYHAIEWLPGWVGPWAAANIGNAIVINVMLAVFNMIPVPPLDGGRVAVGLLPNALALPLARVEPYGILIVIALFMLLPWLTSRLGVTIDLFRLVLQPPVEGLIRLIFTLAGHG
jgi:Zn-dependent protease